MYTLKKYNELEKKYGSYSSWAIWNEDNKKDTCIIRTNYKQLNSKYVFLGLNISKDCNLAGWQNFHGGRQDWKLVGTCNHTKLRGSYLADIFKNIPIKTASELKKYIQKNQKVIKQNVDFFNKEMKDIGMTKNTVFIVLGKTAQDYFRDYFQNVYKNKVVNYLHYSAWGTKKEWAEGLWKKLGIEN